MKRILLIIFLIPILLQSQWVINVGSNKFDRSYKLAKVLGSGGELPYDNPTLNIICWNEDSPSVYISNIRYKGCSDPFIHITFNNTEKIYSFEATPSTDNEAALINFGTIKNSKDLKILNMEELFKFLKTKNKVYLRYSDSCGNEDYVFGLSGSTKAIDYVTKEYFEKETIGNEKETIRKEKEYIRKNEEAELELYRAEIAKKEKEEKELLKLEAEKKKKEELGQEIAAFEKVLIASFQSGELPLEQFALKELFKLKFEEITKLKGCSQQDARGRIIYDIQKTFFTTTEYTFYNRIRNNCILMTNGVWGGSQTNRYFIDIDDLAKYTDNPKIQLIKEKWGELVYLSTRNK